ncbi:MAG TPA: pitrilysin family protein [Cytophagaceae bacterium]|nr:pitrilysin family protein [Cytophagaceae bacterium]
MTTLDRTIAPSYKNIDSYILPEAESVKLANGIPLHFILSGTQPVVRMELIFKAGNWYEPNFGCAHFLAKMLSEGTSKHTAHEIQDMFAYYGAFPEFNSGVDHSSVTVYTLSKHLEALLPLIHELVSEAMFPEKEFENAKNITLQSLKVNKEKTAFLAGSKFREMLFGSEHPYGYYLSEEAIEAVSIQSLQDFYKKNYTISNCEIVLSGGGDLDFVSLINKYLGSDNWGKNDTLPYKGKRFSPVSFSKRELITRETAVQSSIRMGRKIFSISHPDYFNLYFLNEIFGGYFGSRLMQNIREDKGYTYGINSNLATYNHEGYFVIGTDVKREFTQQTLDEIYKEMKKLKEEKVSQGELETVRNYMLGSFVNSITTPFAVADKFKTIHFNGLGYDFYKNYFTALKNTTSETLMATAQKYFDENSMSEAIAGGI